MGAVGLRDQIKISDPRGAGGPVEDVKKTYMPRPVGIASRSGGMTTEIANLLTTNGIGQAYRLSSRSPQSRSRQPFGIP